MLGDVTFTNLHAVPSLTEQIIYSVALLCVTVALAHTLLRIASVLAR
jgi:hypothetical protein